ncbi:flagellar basal body L-ring protein FlgH [Mariniblastus sp.]|jgi:flagellar L-ring protein FlgH|nr:flagellar basal body L-ring protein FlgH [Mariniblastus sp.]MDB4756298.1 flagellar basal body L-ring protein FlgH [Mariniblastus sp.]
MKIKTKNTKLVLSIAALVMLLSGSTAIGQVTRPYHPFQFSPRGSTMFNRVNSRDLNPYADPRAMQVGDLLTVEIDLGTTIDNQDQRSMKKTTESTASADFGATGSPSVDANYNSSSDRSLKGDSQLRETRRLKDQFNVTVIGVRGNNLLIQGRREVKVQGDFRGLILTGEVRRTDVELDNTIASRHIHNMRLNYEGKGPEQNYTREGWLKRQISKVWPF